MSSESQPSEKFYQKYAWVILFVLGVLLSLNTIFIIIRGTDPTIFKMDTGVEWSEFASAYPTVATLSTLLERLVGTGYLGISLFATIIAFFKYRKVEKWAWYTMWVLPAMLALTAILMYLHDQAYVGIYYLIFSAVALVGLLLPVRKFFPKAGA